MHKVLAEQLPDEVDGVRVISYVRPHASRFLAAFVQRIKTGHYLGNLETFLERIGQDDTLNYAIRLAKWQNVFGNSFVLRPYIRSELYNDDVVADFYRTLLGSEPFTIAQPVRENTSVSLRALAGLRLLQRRMKNEGLKGDARGFAGTVVANFHLPKAKATGTPPTLDRSIAGKLVNAYRQDADKTDGLFFAKPLMREALETTLSNAGDTPFDLTPAAHFNAQERRDLISLSQQISALILNDPRMWSMSHRFRIGQIIPSPRESRSLSEYQPQYERIDSSLKKVAEILCDEPL